MAFCNQCGSQIDPGAKFCPTCGTTAGAAVPPQAPPQYQQAPPQYQQQQYQQAPQYQQQPYSADKDIADNKVMAVLAYFGLLVLIPILAAKESRFVRYHANQGLVLFITAFAYGIAVAILSAIVTMISWQAGLLVGGILWVGYIAIFVFLILGIVNAAGGKMKPLPLIGGITILK